MLRKLKYYFVFFIIFLLSSTCIRDNIKIDLKSNDWEIVKIRKQGEFLYSTTVISYIVKFIDNDNYTIKLDVNNCIGNYNIGSKGKIEIISPACTKICCDSDFAIELMNLLPKMSNYYISGNELFLEGIGEIVLRKK